MTNPEYNREFENLLDYLKRTRGFDFTGYKRASLMRRVSKRMQSVTVETYGDYLDYLEVHPDEFSQLFNTILINVTSFYRDAPVWEYLRDHVLPQLAQQANGDSPIRLWTAGCASGEEAYTLAMVTAESLGIDQFRDRVKIYATDVDEDALSRARQASYTQKDVSGIPQALLDKYFDWIDGRYVFRKEVRRSVIFGRNDLIQDAPISRIDLLLCRNTLMYFNAETQARILSRFHFALKDNGFLLLGRAEMLFTAGSLFAPVDLKRRVFSKLLRSNGRDRLLLMGGDLNGEGNGRNGNHSRLRESAFDSGPTAQIVVDPNGYLVLANDRARALFGIALRDLGRPIQDLEISYRPVELRSLLDQVSSERCATSVKEVGWIGEAGDTRWLDVFVQPLQDLNEALLGISISFQDVSLHRRLQEELEHSHQELETAYEELQSTNEELETTNEELQSTVEELETTNEELQSTNEELETMNEELQSTNEELQTINEELRRRSEELNQANAFMEAILTSLRGGVAVVERDMHVLVWNMRAEDLWGVRQHEAAGRNFLNLDIGLPVERLRPAIRICLGGDQQEITVILDAINRRGRPFRCRVTAMPLISPANEITGVILVMEQAEQNES